jgi:hypothetical protein
MTDHNNLRFALQSLSIVALTAVMPRIPLAHEATYVLKHFKSSVSNVRGSLVFSLQSLVCSKKCCFMAP